MRGTIVSTLVRDLSILVKGLTAVRSVLCLLSGLIISKDTSKSTLEKKHLNAKFVAMLPDKIVSKNTW